MVKVKYFMIISIYYFEGIKHLGQSSAARDKLTVLELDNCPLITDRGLDYLMACKNLKRIELWVYFLRFDLSLEKYNDIQQNWFNTSVSQYTIFEAFPGTCVMHFHISRENKILWFHVQRENVVLSFQVWLSECNKKWHKKVEKQTAPD